MQRQHIIPVAREPNPRCDCCALNPHLKQPKYTQWLAKNGVREADFSRLVEPSIADYNRYADRCVPYTVLTLLSCGLAGWWCQIAENAAINRAGQAAVEKFNDDYKQNKIRVDTTPSGLVFTKLR